jgi:hypothetical protein
VDSIANPEESLANGSIDDLLDVLEYKVKGLEIDTTRLVYY